MAPSVKTATRCIRPFGANVVPGWTLVVTLHFGMAAPLASHLYTFKSLPYDPAEDFAALPASAQFARRALAFIIGAADWS